MEEKSSSTDPVLTKPPEQNDSSSSSSSILNENKKEVEKEKKSVEEVIDLDDSNDEDNKPNTKRPPRKCINAQCTGDDVDLKVAASYCISFFKVKCNRKKKQLVCKDCRKMCLNNMQIMADMLSKGEPIFDHKVPMNVDSVEIIDSDEETIDDESEKSTLEEKDKEELNLEIDELVKRLFDKYNIGYQINWAKDKLERDNKKNEEHFKEIDELLKRLQVKADIVRSSVYSNRPRNTELEPLDIVDDYSAGVAQKSTASHIIGRRSSPRITKPVSYNEDNSPDSPTISPPGHGDQEIIAVDVTKKIVPNLPPVGQIVRPEPKVGNLFYAMKSNTFGSWAICEVLEIMSTGINGKASENVRYRIKFEGIKAKTAHLVKIVSAKRMAYTTKSPVRLHIGNRVIAVFKDSEQTQRRDLFAGIVAEPLSSLNSFRYLIFFDDGYAQYVAHDNVHLFVEESTNVWEDVPLESRDYIKGYLKEYPERPMVKLTRGQIIKTEWNGKWWTARVLQVDGSLVLMYFDADKRSEWIYRGSRRLAPLFNTNQNQKMRQIKGFVTPQRRLPPRKQNAPYVEYTRNTEYVEPTEAEQDHPAISTASRAVARKSTSVTAINFGSKSAPQTIVPFLPTTITQPASKVIYYAPRAGTIPALYKSHQCSPNCNKLTKRKLSDLKNYSLLAKPILSGWFRECIRYSKNKREIRYITPCSRILRTIQELHLYLRITQSEMSVDMFDFNFWVHILAEFCIEKTYVNLPDLSNGEENVPIPCVNYIDCTLPDMCRYTSKREPMQGVNLNLDEEFLCGCDCTDDCQDKTKCACWQLTIQGTMYGKNKVPDMNIGYVYKRLLEPVITGIYECNSRCKCASTCLNRVAQHPLQLKLQVFKTANRGWGIRCLNDVPQGSFICIYAGQLLTEQMANEGGKNFGDEYLAELDYIEVVERLKEGYESDVSEEDMDLSYEDKKDSSQDEEDDDEEDEVPDTRYKRISNKYKDDDSEYVVHTYIAKTNTYNTRLRKRYDETDSNSNSNQGSDSERNEKRARKYGEKSKDDLGKNELIVTEYTTEGKRKEGIDNVNDKIKDINLSSSEQKNDKKQGELPEEESIENSEETITGSNTIKQEIHSETVKDQPKNTMDEDEYVTISDDEMPVTREPSSFIPTVPAEENIENWELKYKSVRTMFGETESCYVMDAKNAGNIGRFLNHSCNPNVFVQNVFVDTHDIRFPWVAFFALTYIRAGTELTWNYNYDVGSVPGKVLYCQCGSSECRGRLL